MKKTLVIVIVALLFLAATATLMAGGGGEPEPSKPAAAGGPAAGGTLTFGVYRPIPNLAYYHAYDASNNITAVAIWDTLLRFNEKAEIEPGLASSWEVKDGNKIILHLREGVKFHDGTTLNAEDVIASMELAVDPESKSPMAWMLDPIDSIVAVDNMTVQIETGAVVDILNALATPIGAVSSKEAVEKYGIGLGEKPIGAGPFKLESW